MFVPPLPDASVVARLYQDAQPFPHAIFDDFLPPFAALDLAEEAFLATRREDLYKYDNPLEKKRALDDVERLPWMAAQAHQFFASPRFLIWLERMTGIEGLIPDPYLRGGGMHLIPPGGKLDVHVDFNLHPKLNLHRRLNAILYLNGDWTEEQGGYLELWSGRMGACVLDGKLHTRCVPQRTLDRCERRILPILNRLVVFSTTENSYHGHPEPTRGNQWRCSLSAYYYTATNEYAVDPHSTAFVRRPEDPEDAQLEALRKRRARGRTASNVNLDGRTD